MIKRRQSRKLHKNIHRPLNQLCVCSLKKVIFTHKKTAVYFKYPPRIHIYSIALPIDGLTDANKN